MHSMGISFCSVLAADFAELLHLKCMHVCLSEKKSAKNEMETLTSSFFSVTTVRAARCGKYAPIDILSLRPPPSDNQVILPFKDFNGHSNNLSLLFHHQFLK